MDAVLLGGLLLAGCGRELLDDVTAGFLPWSFKRARWHWEWQGGAVAFRNGPGGCPGVSQMEMGKYVQSTA